MDGNSEREMKAGVIDSVSGNDWVLSALYGNESAKSVARGRRAFPDKLTLGHRRDAFIWLLGVNWAEIGWQLCHARTSRELRELFGALEGGPNGSLLADLAHKGEERATPKEIRRSQREASRCVTDLREFTSRHDELAEIVREGKQALEEAGEKQKSLVWPKLLRFAKDFRQAKNDLRRTRRALNLVDAKLKSQRAFYTRSEVLDFVRQRKYAFTPKNFAMALAGLPDIGWRRSFFRCSKIKSACATMLELGRISTKNC